MYKVGDYIIKATQGLCRVEDILHLDMSGADKNKLYYLLVPVNDHKDKVYMPTERADSKTRKAMTEEEAWNLIHRIDEIDELKIENENVLNSVIRRPFEAEIPNYLSELLR